MTRLGFALSLHNYLDISHVDHLLLELTESTSLFHKGVLPSVVHYSSESSAPKIAEN